MTDGITITRDQLDQIIRAEAKALLADRLAAIPPADLTPQLDWMPASWFAKQWGIEAKTFIRLARKLGIRFSPASKKTKLYSVQEANERARERAMAPAPRRRSKIVQIA